MKDDPRGVLEELGVREELERRVAEDPAGFLSELYGGALPDSALQMVTGGAELATLSVNSFYSFLQQDAILRFDSPFAPPYVPVGPVV